MIIAIDGLAGAGKGTLARSLAQYYNCQFLPTGNLYRLVARKLSEDMVEMSASYSRSILRNIVNDIKPDELLDLSLGSDELSKAASKLAAVGMVREVLNDFQRHWACGQHIAILEGRDIGTVIFPHADVKLFVTADVSVRADRRAKELKNLGHNVATDTVLTDLLARDVRDQSRTNAPLKQAPDAILLDTTLLSPSETMAQAISIIEKKFVH